METTLEVLTDMHNIYKGDHRITKALNELKAAMKPETCEGCKWYTTIYKIKCLHRDHCKREHKDHYEPKDNV